MAHVFLSHAWADKAEVESLRRVLAAHGVDAWVDSREMVAGDELPAEIRAKIESARAFVLLLTEYAHQSRWVANELELARKVAQNIPGYRVIPIVAEPLSVTAIRFIFGAEHEPLAIPVRLTPGWAEDIAPRLLAALGERLPTGEDATRAPRETPLAELKIALERPEIVEQGGEHRATAEARLSFSPIDGGPTVHGRPFRFVAPFGPIEDEELRWYLERYSRWPHGEFRERAKTVEAKLPRWGRALLDALERKETAEVWHAFRDAKCERRISVCVDPELADASDTQAQRAREAAANLLSLPWELLHDENSFLFTGKHGVRVLRRLPNHQRKPPIDTTPPLRILLVCPRSEDAQTSYIDHRVSALPVVDAVEALGARARLTILHTPTRTALENELQRAADAEEPYHVVHFNGHGIYDRRVGLGALCFEDEADADKLERRAHKAVLGHELAALLRGHRVPLVVLEACQSAMTETTVEASVAGQLLQGGVASVVAMSHSVLVETARRFVAAFYEALCAGQRVGEAARRAQQALASHRNRTPRSRGKFELHDWFVPVLYQEDEDPRLVRESPGATVQELAARMRQAHLGEVPKALPPHGFTGRSRELLRAERTLVKSRYVTLRSSGGEGKTTLAAELAQWLVRTHRFGRAALIAFDKLPMPDRKGALYALGAQIVPNFMGQAAGDEVRAQHLVERALHEDAVVIVFDNLETVLPAPESLTTDPDVAAALWTWIAALMTIGRTRVVLTTREPMPAPLDRHDLPLGRLDRDEAIALVHDVLSAKNMSPGTGEETEQILEDFVETVGRHARSLVLLAPEIALAGASTTTTELAAILARHDMQHPGDRERSLLASVELSLRRLPTETRERLPPLAVFEGGGHLGVMAQVLGLPKAEMVTLAQQLVSVGLAELLPYAYLRLDPALSTALAARLNAAARENARAAWAEAMGAFIAFLYEQQFKDAEIAATLTALDLANLLAAASHADHTAEPARVVALTERLEELLRRIGRPNARATVARLREEAARHLQEWSHATYLAASADIHRLLDAGRTGEALEAARSLLQRAETAGEDAFPEAAYDVAMCHFHIGRALEMRGAAKEALVSLREAQRRFDALSAPGNKDAPRMASVALTEQADCLRALGKLGEAAAAYEEALGHDTARGDRCAVAVGKGQLGTVRLLQRQYTQAIEAYKEALAHFTALGDSTSMAVVWHQLAMAYRHAGQFEAAEEAYLSSLRLESQLSNRAGEASTLGELGTLYADQARHEDAVRFHRRSAEIHTELRDLCHEGLARNNAAVSLLQLGRLDEARHELQRALECTKPFGHAAEPWTTHDNIADLEHAAGNPTAAATARGDARAAFLAYRRDGGENHNPGGRLVLLVNEALRAGITSEARAMLADFTSRSDLPSPLLPMLAALTAILDGDRNPALADDPALHYTDAVELQLLLESLTRPE